MHMKKKGRKVRIVEGNISDIKKDFGPGIRDNGKWKYFRCMLEMKRLLETKQTPTTFVHRILLEDHLRTPRIF